MEDNIYYFNYFNGFTVTINGKFIDLRKECGKQLSNLLAFLLEKERSISKDELIDTLWTESDSPRNALKFAIYRLRNKLKEVDGLPDVEYVVTTASGYQFNPTLKFVKDCVIFEQKLTKAINDNDFATWESCFDDYTGDYLNGIEANWIDSIRRHYKDLMLKTCNRLASIYLSKKDPKKAIILCNKGLRINNLDERLIYTYLNALINDHQYNNALVYYQNVNEKYKRILGLPLHLKSQLKEAIEQAEKSEAITFDDDSFDVENFRFKAMSVDIKTFKSLCEYAIRNYIVTKDKKYLVTIKTKGDIEGLIIMDKLIPIIQNTIRCNDVICVDENNSILLLVSLNNKEEADIIYNRIIGKLDVYNDINSSELNYNVKNLIEEEVSAF